MNYFILFKKDKNGNILYWKISVETALGGAQIRKEFGLKDTKNPQVYTTNITEDKLIQGILLSPIQQAELIADKTFKKKLNHGWSLEELKFTGVFFKNQLISLEDWIRNKLQELEEMHDYAAATDQIRYWIDEYNKK